MLEKFFVGALECYELCVLQSIREHLFNNGHTDVNHETNNEKKSDNSRLNDNAVHNTIIVGI